MPPGIRLTINISRITLAVRPIPELFLRFSVRLALVGGAAGVLDSSLGTSAAGDSGSPAVFSSAVGDGVDSGAGVAMASPTFTCLSTVIRCEHERHLKRALSPFIFSGSIRYFLPHSSQMTIIAILLEGNRAQVEKNSLNHGCVQCGARSGRVRRRSSIRFDRRGGQYPLSLIF